jgi:hypothetical protein
MEGRYGADAVPFEPADSTHGLADQLDTTGQKIFELIHQAAEVIEGNARHAVQRAQELSNQLVSARDRIAKLEAEAAAYRERAERAEQWLRRIYSEINDRFIRQRPTAMRGGTVRSAELAQRS